jgi:hypothetical protein
VKRILIIFIPLLLLISSCNTIKRLEDGEYLVHKVKIDSENLIVSNEELMNVVKQRPNRKIFLLGRFHLHMYNLPNPEKMYVARVRKDARVMRRNNRRKAKNKDPLEPRLTSGEWLREVVGEPPVILDTILGQEGADQLSLFLMKKGYFKNSVKFSYKKRDKWPKKNKAKISYTIDVESPYVIDSIEYDIKDPNIDQIIKSRQSERLIEPMDQFDVEKLDEERSRITNILRNDGYYFFVKEYIEFEADSINKVNKVDLKMSVLNPNDGSMEADSGKTHTSFSIGEVYVNFQVPSRNDIKKDTTIANGYHIIGGNLFPVSSSILTRNIFINKGEKYQKSKVEFTYRRLLSFEVISLVNIQFIEDPLDSEVLNAIININFNKRKNISLETTGTTNSGDNLGMKVSAAFKHKSIFGSAEVLNLQLQGGVESQNLITDDNTTQIGTNPFDLNTIELGPTLSLKIPKLIWPLRFLRTSKSSNQSTIISTAYNYQRRDDYTRSLVLAGIGFTLWETPKTKFSFSPLESNVIKILKKSNAFIARLEEINDQFLSDSYSDHFILASNASYILKTRSISGKRLSLYNKSSLEWGGNLLRAFANSLNLTLNDEGSYEIFNIPFAQYGKISNDLRLYHNFNKKSSMAFRTLIGVGVPFDNIDVLPFSRSFYGGGANGNRAWKARSLGPGSYFEEVTNFDKIGDIHLETNLEYRFDLINYLEGALFIDAGNIWLYNSDSIRVGGLFDASTFLGEIAIGVGLGARLNFDYFLVRFDLALQAKDPSLPIGERWLYQTKEEYNTIIEEYNNELSNPDNILSNYRARLNFNLGIGYPF